MTAPRLFPARGRVTRAWRNGGGTTQDIATFPPGASDEDFVWRASLATISGPGAFSLWPGIDRVFRLVEGNVRLSIDGVVHQLGGGDPAIAFAGEAEVWGEPAGGHALALNIMTTRASPQYVRLSLLLARRHFSITVAGRRFELKPGDAVLTGPDDLPEIDPGDGLVVEIVT